MEQIWHVLRDNSGIAAEVGDAVTHHPCGADLNVLAMEQVGSYIVLQTACCGRLVVCDNDEQLNQIKE